MKTHLISEMEFKISVIKDLLEAMAVWSQYTFGWVLQMAETRVSQILIAPRDELYAIMLQC
jgi:hypothetical protein